MAVTKQAGALAEVRKDKKLVLRARTRLLKKVDANIDWLWGRVQSIVNGEVDNLHDLIAQLEVDEETGAIVARSKTGVRYMPKEALDARAKVVMLLIDKLLISSKETSTGDESGSKQRPIAISFVNTNRGTLKATQDGVSQEMEIPASGGVQLRLG